MLRFQSERDSDPILLSSVWIFFANPSFGPSSSAFLSCSDALAGLAGRDIAHAEMVTNRGLIGQGGRCLFGQRNCGPVVALMITGPTEGIFELRYLRFPQNCRERLGFF